MSRPSHLLAAVLTLSACNKATVVVTPEPESTTTPAPTSDQQAAQEQVREAARHYAEALSQRDPAAAVEWVVADTLSYYEDLRIAALRATRDQLERWDLMSVMLVLQIRNTVARSELETVDGRALFEQAVREGLVGAGVEQVPLDEVWVADDGTHAEIRIEDQPVVWLRREGDEHWRVDIPEMIHLLGPALEAMAQERVVADGKLRTAFTLIELGGEASVDIAVLDGPLEVIDN